MDKLSIVLVLYLMVLVNGYRPIFESSEIVGDTSDIENNIKDVNLNEEDQIGSQIEGQNVIRPDLFTMDPFEPEEYDSSIEEQPPTASLPGYVTIPASKPEVMENTNSFYSDDGGSDDDFYSEGNHLGNDQDRDISSELKELGESLNLSTEKNRENLLEKLNGIMHTFD